MVSDGGVSAWNTVIRDSKHEKKVFESCKAVAGSRTYRSKTTEDHNAVIFFKKEDSTAKEDFDQTELRLQRLKEKVSDMSLNKGIFLNKKSANILYHTELMRCL